MSHQYLSSSQIHNGKHWLPKGSIIEISDRGIIINIHDEHVIARENVKYFDGILCPGFVNVHCHIELSHMKSVIEEGSQLVPFLQSVMLGRNDFSQEEKEGAIKAAIKEMKRNGIVAVGDIVNGTDTLKHRPDAGLHIHTFVEGMGFTIAKAEERFAYSVSVHEQFAAQKEKDFILRQSIVPHAPYSVSGKMFDLINSFDNKAILSIHNEETQAENELYQSKRGDMFNLYESLNIDASFFEPSGKTSLQTYLPNLSSERPLILVHNTFMNEEDILFLKHSNRNFYLCLCPNANWYIERRLPPVSLFAKNYLPICLGTDSLASNRQLSIWSEVQTIQKHFPEIEMEQLLKWATYNGALALEMETHIGSIERGKNRESSI